jgi:hypothetical protein
MLVSDFVLKFSISDVKPLASKYRYATDVQPIMTMVPLVRQRGHLMKSELEAVGRWKAPRVVPKVLVNEESFIHEATRIALSTSHERMRIETLTLLHGVQYPMASVILHFCHADRYPIIDFRALWSLGFEEVPAYSFEFWMEYVYCCRDLADKAGVDMRTLDKSLWQHSKQHQPPRKLQAVGAD